MNTRMLLGVKLFKEIDDGFEIVRVVRQYHPSKVKIRNESTNVETKIDVDTLRKEYQALQPIGFVSLSVVTIGENKDIIVTLTRHSDVQSGLSTPCVICRQSVTDFFYNLISNVEDHGYVGVSVSESNCPTNIEYGTLLACDDIDFSEIINVYYDDTINSILSCASIIKYNDVLYNLYSRHVDATKNKMLMFKDEDKGWCKNINKLLTINNFQLDYDNAFYISDVDFNLDNYIIEKVDDNNKPYQSLTTEALGFFSSTFKLNMVDSIIVKYGYDIDLSEYRNENYVLIRDKTGDLYLLVYLIDGAYLEQDIEAKKIKEDVGTAFRLSVYNKYKESQSE